MEKPLPSDHDYIYSVYETCEILGKSSRTISRYVRRGILHPAGIKSCQGTLEYRFSKAEVEAVRQQDSLMQRLIFPANPYVAPDPSRAAFATVNYQPPQTTRPAPYFMPAIPRYVAPRDDGGRVGPERVSGFREENPAAKPVEIPAKNDETSAKQATPPMSVSQDSVSGQNRSNEQIIILLKETTEMLRDQLKVKDDQIKNLDDKIGQLIERNRETNILLKGLQDKVVLLDKPKNERKVQTRQEPPSMHGAEVVRNPAPAPKAAEAASDPVRGGVLSNVRLDSQPVAQVVPGAVVLPVRKVVPIDWEGEQGVAKTPDKGGFLGKIFGGKSAS